MDKILSSLDTKILTNSGTVSHKNAIDKAKEEYKKYQVKELTSIEKEYLNSIKNLGEIVENIDRNR